MAEMKILASREEWLQNRQRIGGSDASAILGMNPYRTNVELWQIKTGQLVPEDISDKPYVKYGTDTVLTPFVFTNKSSILSLSSLL